MSNWNDWEKISNNDELKILEMILKYTRFVSPEIIKLIVKDNNSKIEYFTEILKANKVNPEIYLWENSSVLFPGVRRHSGQKEITKFKNNRNSKGKKSILLDDNRYPKMLWSFLMIGEKFQVNKAPKKYSLAHLIDHKDYGNRRDLDIKNYKNLKSKEMFYSGLFTSAVNTIYINNSLMKPTDFNNILRKSLLKIIDHLYSDVCEILPFGYKLNIDKELGINIDYKKLNLVGNKSNVGEFIKFRDNFYREFE
jgi:hypothetical protein